MKTKLILAQGLGTSDAVDFDSMWDVLASSLREIHTKNASKLSFEELYRNAYKLVLKKRGETLYIRVKEFEEEWLANEVQPRILEELSQTLLLTTSGAQTIVTANEKRFAGEKLLRALKQAWEDHNLCMNMTTDVLMYMVGNFQNFKESYKVRKHITELETGPCVLQRLSKTLNFHCFYGAVPRSRTEITSF